ncbi:hypothetical protein DSECCO2_534000 [anaerobic digester metagenome]
MCTSHNEFGLFPADGSFSKQGWLEGGGNIESIGRWRKIEKIDGNQTLSIIDAQQLEFSSGQPVVEFG